MLKITAIGNLTNDVELKVNETTGKPYAILRIASDRRYRDRDGNRLTDFISIKVRGPLAERCAEFAWKGCKLAAVGDFETICFADDPDRQPGFLIKATEVEFLSPRRAEEAAMAAEEPDSADAAYRKRLGQRLMASLRDEGGKREVLANGKGSYVVLEGCGDRRQLKQIRRRIQNQMKGLDLSARKVSGRLTVLERLARKWRRAG